MAKRQKATRLSTESEAALQESEHELVRRVCASFADAQARRAAEESRILGDPRTVVHLPFSDQLVAAAPQFDLKPR